MSERSNGSTTSGIRSSTLLSSRGRPPILDRLSRNRLSLICYGAFSIAYLGLSWGSSPHVIDSFPDSPSYLAINFLGHAERLWTVPVIYSLGIASIGRVMLQTVIGLLSWTVLSVQLGKSIQTRLIRFGSQLWVLLLALTAPLLQWNRTILSESIAISLSLLLVACSLAFARRKDGRSLAALVLVLLLWAFVRQDQAIVTLAFLVIFAVLAWLGPNLRRLALFGLSAVAFISLWAVIATVNSSHTTVQYARLAQFVEWRAFTNPDEIKYLYKHGLPHNSVLKSPPPFTRSGEQENVNQFGDPYLGVLIELDPAFSHWARTQGENVLLGYTLTHPWPTVSEALVAAPQLMTMNPDYLFTPALPQWLSTLVYGNLSARVAQTASGAPRSSDPIFLLALLGISITCFSWSAFRGRFSSASVVGAFAIGLAAPWCVLIWNEDAGELPREFVVPAVFVHVALVVLLAGSLDTLFLSRRRGRRRSGSSTSGVP